MKYLKGISLGDLVELDYQKSFTLEISKVAGYVKSLDENYLELSSYDPEHSKPFNNDSINYEVKWIKSCKILQKKE